MIKIIVLMATFNGGKYVRQQLHTILNQKDVDVLLIIRDDGSTDNTVNICNEIASEDNRVNVVDAVTPTGTPAGNFYKLLMYLYEFGFNDFDYIAFADQDDIWMPEKLSAAITKIGNDGCAYSSNLMAFSEGGKRVWVVNKFGPQTEIDFIFQGASAGCTYVFKCDALDSIVETLKSIDFEIIKFISHDWLIYAIVRSMGKKWVMDDNSYIFYRQHQNNNYGDKKGWQLMLFKFSLVKSGWYFKSVRLIFDLTIKMSRLETLRRLLNGKGVLRYMDIYLLLKSRRSLKDSVAVMLFYIFANN